MRRLLLLWRLERKRSRRQSRSGRKAKSNRERRHPLELVTKHLLLRQKQRLRICKGYFRNHRVTQPPWLLMSHMYVNATGWEFTAYKNTGAFAQPCLLPSGRDSFGSCGLLMGCTCSVNYSCDLDVPRLASSGGLMCGLFTADADCVYGTAVVFNCLTGSAKALPPPLHRDLLFAARDMYNDWQFDPCPCHIYMAVDDSDPMRYYIMLSRVCGYWEWCFSISDIHTEVFDSKTGGWTDATFQGDLRVCHDPISTNVWDGSFFFVYHVYNKLVYLAAYSVAHDEWSVQQLPLDLAMIWVGCKLFCIHKFEGRVFFAIQPIGQHGFEIWEVSQTSSRAAMWVKIASTPQYISRDPKWNRLKGDFDGGLVAAGNYFYFIIYVDGFTVCEIPPLVFDITTCSWYFFPAEDWRSNYYAVLLHQPSLNAHF